jgi:hypothetical protein
MKPLLADEVEKFLARFENFADGTLNAVITESQSVITVVLSAQDQAREMDWVDIAFEISEVVEANLVDESTLAYLDMTEGISIIFEEDLVAFCIENCNSIRYAKTTPLFIVGKNIKYEERAFSG